MTLDLVLKKGKLELFVSKYPKPCWGQFDNYFNFFDRPLQINYDTRMEPVKSVYISIFCIKDAQFKIKYKFRIDIFGDYQAPAATTITTENV